MDYDVVVIGAGNAAMCSALAAEEVGAKVLVLEAATEELGGGNTRYTAGAIRTVYNGVDDLRELMPDPHGRGVRNNRLWNLYGRSVFR